VRFAELELVRLRRSVESPSQSLNSALTAAYGLGLERGPWAPFAMVSLGVLNLGARAGVWYAPRGLRRPGPVARVDLRAQWHHAGEGLFGLSLCFAVGWRDLSGRSGLFSVDAGPAWGAAARWYVGWAVSMALDVVPRPLARPQWVR
jgi:hypothetical protein